MRLPEGVVGAIAAGALTIAWFIFLATLGIDPDEALRAMRTAPGEDRALLLALLLSLTLGFLGVVRYARERRERSALVVTPASATGQVSALSSKPVGAVSASEVEATKPETAPRNTRGKVKVGNWIPEIATIEHGGALWTTMMSPISGAEIISGGASPPDLDDIEVKYPPLCPNCRTDLEERSAPGATLEDRIAGGGREMICTNCGWKQNTGESMSVLRQQAEKKARGMLRRLLYDRGLS